MEYVGSTFSFLEAGPGWSPTNPPLLGPYGQSFQDDTRKARGSASSNCSFNENVLASL